jgi:protein O-GlcNAc transferase
MGTGELPVMRLRERGFADVNDRMSHQRGASQSMSNATAHRSDALRRAIEFYRTGKLDDAEALCRGIIGGRADNFDALCLLALVQDRLGRRDEALQNYNRALALRPNHAPTLYNRGVTLQRLRRWQEALQSYDRAVSIRPDFVVALVNRGSILRDLKRYEEALKSYDAALAVKPGTAELYYNRGNVLRDLRRGRDALECYDKALAIKPDYAAAHSNRGLALWDLRRYQEAVQSYEAAIAIDPGFADAHANRGLALWDLKRYEDALTSFDAVLSIEPDHAETLHNRGVVLLILNRHLAAIQDFVRAQAIDPHFKYLRGLLLHTKMQCGDWDSFAHQSQQLMIDVRAAQPVSGPLALLGVSASARDQLTCAQTWVRDKCPPSTTSLFRGESYTHDRIRVAYLSGDFHDHPVSRLMSGVFDRHDPARFETIAVSFGPERDGAMRQQLKGAFRRFIDAHHESDRQIVDQLRDLKVDIAVDLMGFTRDARTSILAMRPAPVQVNYLGYPGTMGAPYIDYIIADRFVIPEVEQRFYTENVVYLPDCFQANGSKPHDVATKATRSAAGLPETGFVFCSFNKSYKITPMMFDSWMRLLRAIEGSVLWLFGLNAVLERNLRHEAQRRGVAADRLIFAPRVPYPEYLARFALADLFLDTFPFNGGSTASDALWAGLPLVTVCGEALASRMAGSLLHAVGLPELVTDSLANYETLALRLAEDRALLGTIKAKLTQNRTTHPLFDTDRFRRHLEAAYIAMWQRCRRRELPETFAVGAIDGGPVTTTERQGQIPAN